MDNIFELYNITNDDISRFDIWEYKILKKYKKKFDIDEKKSSHIVGLSMSEIQIFIKESLRFWYSECPTTIHVDGKTPLSGFEVLKFMAGICQMNTLKEELKKLEIEIDPETISELQDFVNQKN
jgi:hypothetical protein